MTALLILKQRTKSMDKSIQLEAIKFLHYVWSERLVDYRSLQDQTWSEVTPEHTEALHSEVKKLEAAARKMALPLT